MTSQAKIQKRIYNELLKSEKRQIVQHEYIPEKLEVRNVASYLTGAGAEEAKERLFAAFHEAFHYAAAEGYDISSVRLGSASDYGYSKGATVFVADAVETEQEFENRISYEAQEQAYNEWAPLAKKRAAKRELAKAQANLDKLSK